MNIPLPLLSSKKEKMPVRPSKSKKKMLYRLNNTSLNGKKMKVELQDNARRRKGGYDK